MSSEGGHSSPASSGARPRGTRARPVAQLLVTLVALVLQIGVSLAVIGLVKARYDRRLDREVLQETVSGALAQVRQGKAAEAEARLVNVLRMDPRFQEELTWEFIDYMCLMPQVRDAVRAQLGQRRDPTSPDLLAAELAWRAGRADEAFSNLRESDHRAPSLKQRKFGCIMAAEWQEFSRIKPLAAEGGTAPMAALPKTSLVCTASSVRFLVPQPASQPSAARPQDADYRAGVRAFYDGRLVEAGEALSRDWQTRPGRADTAYFLGAVHEARGELETARTWYGRALSARNDHASAAEAYLRLTPTR